MQCLQAVRHQTAALGLCGACPGEVGEALDEFEDGLVGEVDGVVVGGLLGRQVSLLAFL